MSFRYPKGGFIQLYFNPLTSSYVSSYLYAWGLNGDGQVGNNSGANVSSPTQIGASTLWGTSNSQVAVGRYNAAAIKQDGTLWCWGKNDSGQLGQNDVIARSSPVQVGALTNWSYITTGSGFTVGIKTDGTLWSWGLNDSGQLGQNNTTTCSSPIQVGAGATWSKAESSESYNVYGNIVLAIKTDGTLWSWGLNTNGGLGQNDRVDRSSPVQVGALTTWSDCTVGGNGSTGAIKTDGTIWLIGYSNYGQLGQNNKISRSSPTQVGALTTWISVNMGYATTTGIKGGELWCWGYGQNGQIGDSTLNDRSSPVQIGALTTWSKSIIGVAHGAAIKTDGTLWTWGGNNNGQLGINSTTSTSSPVQVGSGTGWRSLAGSYGIVATTA